jgi:NAD(P)-dependent dehydrogenase (short-subunit alcohol dehydrogenase family)
VSTRFEGRVAFVTGGARGIGRATVERLASEGARVAFCDVDADVGEQTAAEIGHDVRFHTCDIADEQQIAEAVSRTQEEFGNVTVLVNNAGVNANFDMATMTTDEWDRFMAVDLRAAWLTAKYVVPGMQAAGGGAIVNVSSMHGFVTLKGFFPYAAAKAGLLGLTRSMALDYGEYGIRVNAICPGFIRTRLVQDSIDLNPDPAAAEATMLRGVALQRMAEAAEVAAAIAFFASDDASYITGASLMVDGGLTARRAG